VILKCWHRPEKKFVSTDESCNVLEVQAKHPSWLGCVESAGLSSRGMCIEVYRELGRPGMFLKEQVGKPNREMRQTITSRESDRFILGSTHAAEGTDSEVEACGRTHIPDKVELEKI
jgi:hypothetical protein